MNYTCSVCKSETPRELSIIIPHTEVHIVDEIKKKHFERVEDYGICKKCYNYYKKQFLPRR